MRADIDAIVRAARARSHATIRSTSATATSSTSSPITYTINAQSKEQVVALANALQANKDVIMLI